MIAKTGERCATSRVYEDSWVPDLVLADSSAASVIEHELMERTSGHEPDIPVVFIAVPWENFTTGIETTCKLIYKPFTEAELVAALQGACGLAN